MPGVVRQLTPLPLFVFLGPVKVFPLLLVGWGVESLRRVFFVLLGVSSILSAGAGFSYSRFNELIGFSSITSVV